jgi:hypothetical protein
MGESLTLRLPVQTSAMSGAFAPDRLRLLSGDDGPVSKVQIWDVDTGTCLQVLTGHKGPVAALATSRVLRAYDDCSVSVNFPGNREVSDQNRAVRPYSDSFME